MITRDGAWSLGYWFNSAQADDVILELMFYNKGIPQRGVSRRCPMAIERFHPDWRGLEPGQVHPGPDNRHPRAEDSRQGVEDRSPHTERATTPHMKGR